MISIQDGERDDGGLSSMEMTGGESLVTLMMDIKLKYMDIGGNYVHKVQNYVHRMIIWPLKKIAR